jgi:hypothetical protein
MLNDGFFDIHGRIRYADPAHERQVRGCFSMLASWSRLFAAYPCRGVEAMSASDAKPAESASDPRITPLLSREPGMSHSAEFELRCLRRMSALTSQFREGRDMAKVLRATLRAGLELLGAKKAVWRSSIRASSRLNQFSPYPRTAAGTESS